jgi:hypothetical protein
MTAEDIGKKLYNAGYLVKKIIPQGKGKMKRVMEVTGVKLFNKEIEIVVNITAGPGKMSTPVQEVYKTALDFSPLDYIIKNFSKVEVEIVYFIKDRIEMKFFSVNEKELEGILNSPLKFVSKRGLSLRE